MSYATVIKAESVGQDIKVEITSNRRGIGLDAGCEFPNADGTNTDATKVEFKDNAAMDFLRKILNEVSYPQASILATVLTSAAIEMDYQYSLDMKPDNYLHVTVQLQG